MFGLCPLRAARLGHNPQVLLYKSSMDAESPISTPVSCKRTRSMVPYPGAVENGGTSLCSGCLGNLATFWEWRQMLISRGTHEFFIRRRQRRRGLSPDETTPLPAEVPSVLRVQQLTIACDKFNHPLPVGRFAENAEDYRTHFFGDVV